MPYIGFVHKIPRQRVQLCISLREDYLFFTVDQALRAGGMGLEYFRDHCPSQVATEFGVKAWCVAKSGPCCGVCPDPLATLGTRVGLAVLIFFTILVIVYDGAEAPYNFLTMTISALAYLVTVVQTGLRGKQISKFHAYYALFSSMGFICPLAAVALTPNAFLYGEAQSRSRLLNMTRKTARKRRLASLPDRFAGQQIDAPPPHYRSPFYQRSSSLQSKTASSRLGSVRWVLNSLAGDRQPKDTDESRPLTATNPFTLGDTTSAENSPLSSIAYANHAFPADYLLPRPVLSSRSRSRTSMSFGHSDCLERKRTQSRSSHASSTSSSRPSSQDSSPILHPLSATRHLASPQELRDDLGCSQHSLTALPQRATVSTVIKELNSAGRTPMSPASGSDSRPEDFITARTISSAAPAEARPRRRLHKPRPAIATRETSTRKKSPVIPALTGSERVLIHRRVHSSAWRRRGYLIGSVSLSLIWLSTFLLSTDALGTQTFTFSQMNCDDPLGTQLLFVTQVCFIALLLIIIALLGLNLYNDWLPLSLARPFIFTQAPHRYQRAILPGFVSLTIFGVWQALLWTAYEQAASPQSSLQAADEQATTFATVLAFCLCIKPVLDLIKAIAKHVQLIKVTSESDGNGVRIGGRTAATCTNEPGSSRGSAAGPGHRTQRKSYRA